MLKVYVNRAKTQAVVETETKTMILSHSENQVMDLVATILQPIGCESRTLLEMNSSLEDTIEIELDRIETKG